MTTQQAFALACQHHQAGRLKEAESLYRQILAVEPNHADAWHMLGVMAHQAGRTDLAVEWIRHALVLKPQNFTVHNILGTTLAGQSRFAEAALAYRRALELKPDFVDAWNNLGAALAGQDKFDEAVTAYRRALQFDPNHAGAHNNLGIVLAGQGRLEEAMAAFQQALALNANYAEARLNLGITLSRASRFDEAIAHLRQGLELKPNRPEPHYNLGSVLSRAGRLDEAVAAFRRALELQPNHPDTWNHLGIALTDQGRLEEAATALLRALELRPIYPEAHNNLGVALARQSRFDEATIAYRRALELKPDFAEACNNLGMALANQGGLDEATAAYHRALELDPAHAEAYNNLGLALVEQGQLDEAISAYHRAVDLKPKMTASYNNLGNALKDTGRLEEAGAAYRRSLELNPAQPLVHSNVVFTLHFRPGHNDQMIAEEHRRWNAQFAKPLTPLIPPHLNDRTASRRLRIGYVSPDFRIHAVSFFLLPLLEAHDHESFEIYAYGSVRRPDAMTDRVRNAVDVWRDVRALSDRQLAEQVRADRIDILVDLSLHTAENRLSAFAHKPAPVQVSWLAYPGSAGLETIDYRLTDARLDPGAEQDDHPGGQAVRLPDAWCCYGPMADFPPVSSLPAAEKGFVTFGSLNKFSKLHEALLRRWAELLGAVPDSRLLMICPPGRTRERVHTFFAACGVSPERIELVAPSRWEKYIRLLERIDIALDSFPCNGMTTTCHALWMGVPTVTLAGSSAVSRAGSSLLHALGLPEWIAPTEDEYLRIAAERSSDRSGLTELRRTLRARMQASPLMDAPRFARNIEAAYRRMWHQWCAMPPIPSR